MTGNSAGYKGVEENSRIKEQNVQRHECIQVHEGFRTPGVVVCRESTEWVSEYKHISIREGGSGGGERIFKCTIAHPHSHKKNFITIRQTALSDSRNTHF